MQAVSTKVLIVVQQQVRQQENQQVAEKASLVAVREVQATAEAAADFSEGDA